MSMKKIKYAVSGLLSLCLVPASQCFAQAADLSDCQGIQDRLARYACYDKWDSASGVVRQAVPAARASTPRAQEGEDETSLFGRVFNRDSADEDQPAAVATQQAAPATAENFGRSNARVIEGDRGAELVDTVAAIEQRGPSMVLVTLESGQQWQQMISKRYTLAVGDEVRIYPTRWGNSFRLSSERSGGYIQVVRVDNGSAVATSSPAPAAAAPRATPAQEAPAAQEEAPAAQEEAPAAQEEDDSPGLFGRTVGAIGGVGSRIGGIFTGDSDEEEEEAAAPAAAPQPAPQAAAPAAAAENSVGTFGRTGSSSARVVDGELIDTVASIEQTGPSLLLITLEGGQQWQQMISKRYTLKVGDEVRIYPTRWGNSFRLSSERAGGYIQVERVD
jgi:hypothetical protein